MTTVYGAAAKVCSLTFNYNRASFFPAPALHALDILSTRGGVLIGEIVDPIMTFIPPVNIFHPDKDVIATGASGK